MSSKIKQLPFKKKPFRLICLALLASSFLVTANEQYGNDMDYMNGSSQGFTSYSNHNSNSFGTTNHQPNSNPSDSSNSFGVSLFNSARTLIAGNGTDIETKVTQAVANEGVGVAKSFLEKYFPTVEISYTTGLYGKPTTGVLVVAPLSDRNDVKNTIFTQVSTFYTDNRTTVNLG